MNQTKRTLENSIGTITFNNDERRNPLTMQLLNEVIDALKYFENKKARAVIIRANPGAKVWSAGMAIDELPDDGKDPLTYTHPFEQTLRAITHFPAPVIAMAEGSIWGGACDLATVCDIIIGTKKTTFAITPARLGVAYNSSGILHVIRVFGLQTAKEMFFTGRPITAEKAERMGALNHLIKAEELESFTYETATSICKNSPVSVSVAKRQINAIAQSTALSTSTFELIEELRLRAFSSKDYFEGRKAFNEKRTPNFTGE